MLGDPGIRYFHLWDLFQSWSRGVRTLTLIADYALFGERPPGYHLHNLVWNSAAVSLLYLTIRRLSGRPWLAFFAAALFAAHPLHVEAVVNVTNRKEALCLTFSLIAFLSHVRFLEAARGRSAWLGLTLVAWLLALFSKQVAAVLPLALLAYELLFVPRERWWLARSPVHLALTLAALAAVPFVFLHLDLREVREDLFRGFEGTYSPYAAAISSGRAFWRYVVLLAWPAGLCPDHGVALSTSLKDAWAWLPWLGLLAVAGMALLTARAAPLLAFGLLWMLIHYLPVSNLVPSAYIVADRYMYIPSAGFCLVLAWSGAWLYQRMSTRRPRAALAALAIASGLVLGGYSLQTLRYGRVWKGEEALWTYTLTCNPNSFRAHNSLGNYHLRARDHERALGHFASAAALGFAEASYNRANALFELGRYGEALDDYARAAAAKPNWPSVHYNRGNTLLRLKRYPDAVEEFDQTLELDPRHADAYNNRAWAETQLGLAARALQDYSKAVALSPERAMFHFNLGRAQDRAGDREAALASYRRAAALGSEPARAALREAAG